MSAQQIQKGTTYSNYPSSNSQVTAQNLNDHVDNAILLGGAISSQTQSAPQDSDYILSERGGSLFKYTISAIKSLFESYFPLRSGSSMTGELLLSSNTPSVANAAASKAYVDAQAAAATLPGAIVMWGGSTAPSGWLECDGQSTSGYPNLIAIYGSAVPDLRGEFVRGWDHGKGIDQGRGIKTYQGQSIQPHTHTVASGGQQNNTTGNRYTGNADGINNLASQTTGSAGSIETRPRNFALMYIVKT
jgi:microcystin-dependent protein